MNSERFDQRREQGGHENGTFRSGAAAPHIELLLESSFEAIYEIDLEARCTYVNRAGAILTGYEPLEILGQNIHGILHGRRPDGSIYPADQCPLLRVLKDGKICFTDQEVFWRRDGTAFPVECCAEPIIERGKITGAVVRFTDISQRKKLQAELTMRERLLNSFFSNATVGLCIRDKELRYIQVNEALARMNGHSVESHLGKSVHEVVPGVSKEVEAILKTVLATGKPQLSVELCGCSQTKPNLLRYWLFSAFPIFGDNGEISAVGSVIHDTTDQKQTEHDLRESEAKFRQLAENINGVFWISDVAKNNVYYVSPGYEKIWGRTCESLYKDARSWIDSIHPDDRERVLDAAINNQASGKYDETYRLIRPDGSTRWVRDRAFPLISDGKAYRLVGIAEDVTERKQLESQYLRAQRMESIGVLAGGIAHDLNNVLAPILMSIDLLRDHVTDAQSKELLNGIAGSAQRGADMIRQLLTFSRGIEGNRIHLQVRHLINDIAKIIRQTFPKSVELETEIPRDIPLICGDATQLNQVLMNLCVNARDAMPAGGTLSIRASKVQVDASLARNHPHVKPGEFLLISVSDTGTGMTPDVRERIFEPFFTTKPITKGTGLGLATASGIIKSHGGFIAVGSEPGVGSEFKIFLPAGPEQLSDELEAHHDPVPRGKGELVLLVDDEPAICTISEQVLGTSGYQTLTARDGAQAVALSAQNPGIKLVLTDIAMPVMDGIAAIHAIRSMMPNIKVIVSSGFDAERKSLKARGLTVNAFLKKPFSAETLLRTLRNVLDDR